MIFQLRFRAHRGEVCVTAVHSNNPLSLLQFLPPWPSQCLPVMVHESSRGSRLLARFTSCVSKQKRTATKAMRTDFLNTDNASWEELILSSRQRKKIFLTLLSYKVELSVERSPSICREDRFEIFTSDFHQKTVKSQESSINHTDLAIECIVGYSLALARRFWDCRSKTRSNKLRIWAKQKNMNLSPFGSII